MLRKKQDYIKNKIRNYYVQKAKNNGKSKEKYISDKIKEYYTEKKQNEILMDYYNKNSQENIIRKYYKEPTQNKIIIQNYSKLRKTDPIYKITTNLAIRINKEISKVGLKKTFKYNELLGCSINDFKYHLSLLMEDGMTFDNYGEWQVDHIIPVSFFDFSKIDNIKRCCRYTNLQPLWKYDNQNKSNKI